MFTWFEGNCYIACWLVVICIWCIVWDDVIKFIVVNFNDRCSRKSIGTIFWTDFNTVEFIADKFWCCVFCINISRNFVALLTFFFCWIFSCVFSSVFIFNCFTGFYIKVFNSGLARQFFFIICIEGFTSSR